MDVDSRRDALAAAFARIAPFLLLGLLAVSIAAIVAAAGWTLGYDFEAYARAAHRVLAGEPLYDPSVDVAGGFAIYLYPPPFVVGAIPFALLPEPLGVWAWLATLVACFLAGTALMPVRSSVRWSIVGLAAISLPFLFGFKLGQVGPILYLCFAIGWRGLDRPVELGLSTAAGTIVKLQPALLFGWMLVTRRWAALAVGLAALGAVAALATIWLGSDTWADYAELLTRVSKPVTTPRNMTPGAIAYRAGLSVDAATSVQYAAMAATAAVTVVRVAPTRCRDRFRRRRRREPAPEPAPVGPLRDDAAAPDGAPPRAAGVVGGRDPDLAVAAGRRRLPAGVRAGAGGPDRGLWKPSSLVRVTLLMPRVGTCSGAAPRHA